MPARNEIATEITEAKSKAQDHIRRRYLAELAEYTGRDTILYASGFSSRKTFQVPAAFLSISQEDIQGFMAALHGLKGTKLDLVLHSPGGSLEATEQIVAYLRAKYEHIRAIVPQNAMSAATMLACACDEIILGKHSALGPIDPQITISTSSGQHTAPAQAMLDEFERAKQEVQADPRTAPLWIRRIEAYPQGFLTICQNTIALSIEKVADWLNAYMLSDGDTNGTDGTRIAEWLGNANLHKSHGRPVGQEQAKELGLKIVPLEDDQELQERVLSLFHATAVTFDLTNCMKFVENHLGRGSYTNIQVQVAANQPAALALTPPGPTPPPENEPDPE